MKDGKIEFSATIFDIYFLLSPIKNKGTYNNACINPQAIKVQFAPCHNPLTIKIINILIGINKCLVYKLYLKYKCITWYYFKYI